MRRPRPAARTMALVGLTDMFWTFSKECLQGLSARSPAIGANAIEGREYHADSRELLFLAFAARLASADDDSATIAPKRNSDFSGRAARRELLFLVALLEEIDADLVAIH